MESIIIAVFGSSALAALISGIFTLVNNRQAKHKESTDQLIMINNRLGKIEENQVKAEKDQCRTQLLLMIADYPESRAEILELGRHYFVDLKGDWYLSSLFLGWIDSQKITRPEWFKED